MGRGAQASTIRASDQERAAADAFNQQLQAQLGQTRNILLPQYQNILNNPGLSAADKAAVTGGSPGALSRAFDAVPESGPDPRGRPRNPTRFRRTPDPTGRAHGKEGARPAPTN